MKKRFIFKIDGKILNQIALKVADDVEVLFSGNQYEKIPKNIQDQIDAQDISDNNYKNLEKSEKDARKILFKDKKSSTKDRLDALISHLGLDL